MLRLTEQILLSDVLIWSLKKVNSSKNQILENKPGWARLSNAILADRNKWTEKNATFLYKKGICIFFEAKVELLAQAYHFFPYLPPSKKIKLRYFSYPLNYAILSSLSKFEKITMRDPRTREFHPKYLQCILDSAHTIIHI